ncbi:MAG: DNA repair protein RadA [Gammaproteobacteria bacterium]|nr:MAG: DNA repair protein RadA [Gammaproteobacteria bacterium]
MAKSLQFQCRECAALLPKWSGQCPDCKSWNSIEEIAVLPATAGNHGHWHGAAGEPGIMTLDQVPTSDSPRFSSQIDELDRVLGGGLVEGSVILLGGDPGIGKSTILLQCLTAISQERTALYVTGEESPQQVSLRAHRLNLPAAQLQLLSSTCVEDIITQARDNKPAVMVIDSIQTIYSANLQSAAGSVSQIRESTAMLVKFAKQSNVTIFLVGHVTKEGQLAGPRVLEHMVDTVLYFEGDSATRYRVIRAVKNRFGAVNELGIFAMTDAGLKPVSNPSAIFLAQHDQPVSGSIIMVSREGTRPFLVEIQALVSECHSGNPRRLSVGLESNRLAMLIAILQRHGGIPLYDQDVFINAVGGVRIAETGADLAIILAILSSYRDRPLNPRTLVFGEVGLSGEIRPVANGEERLREASKHGFESAIIPKANLPRGGNFRDLQLIPVSHLADTLNTL